MDNNQIAGWMRNAAQMTLLASGLQDFSIQIIRHILRGGTLDEDAFAKIVETVQRS